MANKRIYFANQQVAFRRDAGTTYTPAHGVQSVAVTTTFNLEQAFELGQLAIYENIEGVPDIEVSMSKVLDGYPLLYHLATDQTTGSSQTPTLAGRSNAKCLVAVGIWPDTHDAAGDTAQNPSQQMEASGLFCSAVTYNFPLEDNFSEDLTLVGNDKGWVDMDSTTQFEGCSNPPWTPSLATGWFSGNNDAPITTGAIGGVNRRENMAFASDTHQLTGAAGIDYCQLPNEVPGVDSNGWTNPQSGTDAKIQSITVSTDLGREELFELGTRQPYARVVTFPVEVTCDIEVISLSGDLINAFSDGCGDNSKACTGIVDNLSNQTIRLATCEGTRIFLGNKNKLASVNYGGGDAGGGNVSITYSYTTFNDMTVMHPQDPNASGATWWTNRENYLKV